MYIHREGKNLLLELGGIIILIYLAMILFVHQWGFIHYLSVAILLAFFVVVAMFFRIPRRVFTTDGERLIAPADGIIVAIEEVVEKEYIKEECIMISIFMNGTDVHVNRYPCDGVVELYRVHPGNNFVASTPKASALNERTTVGLRLNNGQKITIRQVAGFMARRIVCYAREGEVVKQNQEMGFIKFGSRVDLFVPKSFAINVDLQDVVRNAITPICTVQPASAVEPENEQSPSPTPAN